MDDAVVRRLRVEVEHGLPRAAQPVDELVPPVGMLDEQQGEIRGEALTQPHVDPVPLRDGIAEPLVGDLVDDDVGQRTLRSPTTLVEE